MKLYVIRVWGPRATPEEVRARTHLRHDHLAVVFAANRKQANEMVYIVSQYEGRPNSDDDYWPNYQLIDAFITPTPVVVSDCEKVVEFTEEMLQEIKGITQTDGLKKEPKCAEWPLFQVEMYIGVSLHDKPGGDPNYAMLVYAEDQVMANEFTIQAAEELGLYDSDSQTSRVEMEQVTIPLVLWNPVVVGNLNEALGQ